MTKKKTRKPQPRRRLTSYERALEDAERRLEKATDERAECLVRLQDLAREIPYLEDIVRALTASEDVTPRQVEAQATIAAGLAAGPPPAPDPASPPVDQAAFLARFMPRPGRTTSMTPPQTRVTPPQGNSSDPDEFLGDDQGTKILS